MNIEAFNTLYDMYCQGKFNKEKNKKEKFNLLFIASYTLAPLLFSMNVDFKLEDMVIKPQDEEIINNQDKLIDFYMELPLDLTRKNKIATKEEFLHFCYYLYLASLRSHKAIKEYDKEYMNNWGIHVDENPGVNYVQSLKNVTRVLSGIVDTWDRLPQALKESKERMNKIIEEREAKEKRGE